MKKDIQTLEDIKLMVNTFYSRIRDNQILGPIFEKRIQENWQMHLEKMYRFWQTVLMEEHTYNGAPFPPHATMNLEERHFELWVDIFSCTVNDLFEGPLAKEALYRGTLMASIFNSKIQFLKNTHPK